MPNAAFQVRRARPEEATDLTTLAHAAKRHWNYPDAWIAAWRDALTLTPAYVRTHDVFAATDAAGTLLGFYALNERDGTVELDHFWVHPDAMGQGVGRRLFEHAVSRVRDTGASLLEIDADPNAEGFYLKLGARRVGEVVTEVLGTRRVRPLLVLNV